MRRFVLLLLLVLMPLQFSWAAAAVYCNHETAPSAKHFGHHEHQHRADTGDLSKDKSSKSLGVADADCGLCQLAAPAIPSASPAIATRVDASEDSRDEFDYRSHIPQGLERPDRLRAA